MTTDSWPAQKIARLKTLWAEGYSASMVGERLGYSRNAIIKVHRLKLPKPIMKLPLLRQRVRAETPPLPPRLVPLPRRGKPSPSPSAPVVATPRGLEPAPKPEPAVMPDIPGSQLVTLEKRGRHQCRWPVNDGGPYLYCGAQRLSGKSYCAHHQHVSIRPPKRLAVKAGVR